MSKCLLPLSVGKTTEMNRTGTVMISNIHRFLKHNAFILHFVPWYPISIYFCNLSFQAKGQISNLSSLCVEHSKPNVCERSKDGLLQSILKKVPNSDFQFLAVNLMETVAIYCCNVSSINLSQPQICYKK